MRENNNSFRPQPNASVVVQLKDECTELKISGQSQTTHLNFSSSLIWELCNGKRSINDISKMLAKHFSLAIENIYPEIEESIEQMKNAGLLTLINPNEQPGHHPDTNTDEGHLGGYIRGRQSVEPTVHELEHGDPATWMPDLWRWAYESLGVRSMIDIGCGEGHAARYFQDLGCSVLGLEGSLQAKRDSLIPDQHVTHDFTLGTYQPTIDFDLTWCCEFVEHVEERYMKNFLKTFSATQRYLMMTFAAPGQPGFHHVNCQPMDYWLEKIESIGLRFDPGLTEISRAISPPGHYKSHGLLFKKT